MAGIRRLRVLAFAFECDPEQGSERAAGWAVVRAAATFADVTVLVRAQHVDSIHRWLSRHPEVPVRVVGVPAPAAPRVGRHRVLQFLNYLVWVRRAAACARSLCARERFDLAHHVSLAAYWLPSPAARLGLPFVWGPVGGAVVTPVRLWPALGVRGVADELLDFCLVGLAGLLPAARRTARSASVRLVQNRQTTARLPGLSTVVLNHALFLEVDRPRPSGRGTEVVFVGMDARKGPRLAVAAVPFFPADLSLALVGEGPERRAVELAGQHLGVADRLRLTGAIPRAELAELLGAAPVALFCGLREEGGIALAEALAIGVPAVVLGHGGAEAVARAVGEPHRLRLVTAGGRAQTARALGAAVGDLVAAAPARQGRAAHVARATRILQEAYERTAGTDS